MSSMQTYLAKLQTLIQSHPWKAGAVLCALLAFWFGFNGLDIYSQNKTERDVLAARDKAVNGAGYHRTQAGGPGPAGK